MSSKREEYSAKIKQQLDDLNASIDALEAKASSAKADAREAYQAKLKELRQQSKLASAKLSELNAATAESWDKLVADMDKLRDAFKHSFNYFKSQL